MREIIILLSVSLSLVLYSQAIIPSHLATPSLAFTKRINQQNQYDVGLHRSLSLRGGSNNSDGESDESDSECDEESSDIDDDDEEEEEVTDEESEDEGESDTEEENEDAGESDMEENEEDEIESPASSLPVKITLKTSLSNNILIDQSIELTASPTRTVQSLKQSVSRQFKSRPPMDAIVLRLDGQVLRDEILVRDLVDEEDDEEDDEEEGEDDLAKLTIMVDMVPPVDPKFGTEMKERLDRMTNEEVLDAYIANLASMHQNALDLMQPDIMRHDSVDEEDKSNEDEDNEESFSSEPVAQTSISLQQYAIMLKEQITESLSEREIELLEKTDTPSSPQEDDLDNYEGDLLLKESIKRKKRRGGATANVKRALQKNLNINWPDTIRNFLLFLFFGYFGGRNAMSRTIMLLGAPACFIIQARPVKVAIKQLFYTIGEPPGILLSLLPAPQQAIMSCDYDMSLKGVYGDEIDQCNDLINAERESEGYFSEDDEDNSDGDFDDSYDEYDEDY